MFGNRYSKSVEYKPSQNVRNCFTIGHYWRLSFLHAIAMQELDSINGTLDSQGILWKGTESIETQGGIWSKTQQTGGFSNILEENSTYPRTFSPCLWY